MVAFKGCDFRKVAKRKVVVDVLVQECREMEYMPYLYFKEFLLLLFGQVHACRWQRFNTIKTP